MKTIISGRGLCEEHTALGFIVTFADPGVLEAVAPDWDWVWIDCQHGTHNAASMRGCLDAANAWEIPAIVRVPCLDEGAILHALDYGAAGVMVPMVDTPEAAAAAASAAKFPPLGRRSFGSQRLMIREGAEYGPRSNLDTLLVVQIETATALANVAEIAAVPGVDVFFLSPFDLAVSLGHEPGKPWPDNQLESIMETFAGVARETGKAWGAYLPAPAEAELGMKHGCQLLSVATEAALLRDGSRCKADGARADREAANP